MSASRFRIRLASVALAAATLPFAAPALAAPDWNTVGAAIGKPGAVQAGGVEITTLHNHMLNDEPRLFFIHFWANDDALKLAKALRGALDKVRTSMP